MLTISVAVTAIDPYQVNGPILTDAQCHYGVIYRAYPHIPGNIIVFAAGDNGQSGSSTLMFHDPGNCFPYRAVTSHDCYNRGTISEGCNLSGMAWAFSDGKILPSNRIMP